MKAISILIFSFLFNCCLLAQINLVPNPGFEDSISCPNSGGQVWKAKHWNAFYNTPDYFHTCNPFFQFSIPYNSFGYQYPNSGDAYMGVWVYFSWASGGHEFIGADLISNTIIGQKYFVNLKVCLAWNASYGTNTATNKLGVLLSTGNYFPTSSTSNLCQVFADSILIDSINWISIRGSFVADSAYTTISIGNYFEDSMIDTLHLNNSNAYQSYYYIDDVCITTDSLFSEIWTDIKIEKKLIYEFIIYPNPTNNSIVVSNIPEGFKYLRIIDSKGILLESINIYNYHEIKINVSSLISGIYSIVFIGENSALYKKFVKL